MAKISIEKRVLKLIMGVEFEVSNDYIATTLGIELKKVKNATYRLEKKGLIGHFTTSGMNWYFPMERGELRFGTREPWLVHYIQINQKRLTRTGDMGGDRPLYKGGFEAITFDRNPEHSIQILFGMKSVDVRINADNAPLTSEELIWAIKSAEGYLKAYYEGVNLVGEGYVVRYEIGPKDRKPKVVSTEPSATAIYFDNWFLQVYKRKVEGYKTERLEVVSRQPTSVSNILGQMRGYVDADKYVQEIPRLRGEIEQLKEVVAELVAVFQGGVGQTEKKEEEEELDETKTRDEIWYI